MYRLHSETKHGKLFFPAQLSVAGVRGPLTAEPAHSTVTAEAALFTSKPYLNWPIVASNYSWKRGLALLHQATSVYSTGHSFPMHRQHGRDGISHHPADLTRRESNQSKRWYDIATRRCVTFFQTFNVALFIFILDSQPFGGSHFVVGVDDCLTAAWRSKRMIGDQVMTSLIVKNITLHKMHWLRFCLL